MKLLDKLYHQKMGWGKVLLISLGVAVFCGIFGGLPILDDTSFTDMAGGYEWWVFCAVIICVCCEKFWDAGLKCAVFFLITQVGQFYIQALLYSHNFANAWMYSKLWMPIIILTLPGGMVAYFSKKQTWWGSAILGIGCAISTLLGFYYVRCFLENPPRHLLAALFCIASVLAMTFGIQKKTANRIIVLAVAVGIAAVLVVYCLVNGLEI